VQERLLSAKKVRAEACAESLQNISAELPDVAMRMEEIVAEIKKVRVSRF